MANAESLGSGYEVKQGLSYGLNSTIMGIRLLKIGTLQQ